MKLKEILNNISYELVQGNEDISINKIQYDSRKVEEDDMFVCVQGYSVDGHKFAQKAVDLGAKVLIVEKDIDVENNDVTIIKVKDVRKALAVTASNYYGNPSKKLKLIGVTGTNGKTTSVYLLKSILEKTGKKVGLIGTIANHIGDEVIESERTTPESLELQQLFSKMVDCGCEYCVMEVSSHSLDLDRVYGCEFNSAIFTNLTRDHLDFHKTFEGYYNAKFKLFERCQNAYVNIDDSYGVQVVEDLKKIGNTSIKTFSIEKDSDFKAENLNLEEMDVEFAIGSEEYVLGLPGRYNVYNSLGVIGVCTGLGISSECIKEGLKVVVVPGRCERAGLRFNLPFEIILDYAHTADGLDNILKTAREFTKNRLISVFGCGGDRDKVKRPEMGKVGCELSDIAIITSDNPRTENPSEIIKDIIAGVSTDNYITIENRYEAIKHALSIGEAGDIIVLAGKGHEDYQILNTGKIHFDEREVIDEILSDSRSDV